MTVGELIRALQSESPFMPVIFRSNMPVDDCAPYTDYDVNFILNAGDFYAEECILSDSLIGEKKT